MKKRTLPAVIPAVALGAWIANAQSYSTLNYELRLYPNKSERVAFPLENPGYANLFLTPAPNTGYTRISGSQIVLSGDDVLWHQVVKNAGCHVYAIDAVKGPGYSSREHVVITGTLGKSGNGNASPSADPTFKVTVPAVNIDWESQRDETQEDEFVQFCPLTTDVSHHQIVELSYPKDDGSLAPPVVSVSWSPDDTIRLVWEDNGAPFPNGGGINFQTNWRMPRFRVEPLREGRAFTIRVEGVMDSVPDKNTQWFRTPMDKVKGFVFSPELQNITFNHDTASSVSDAINLRQDYSTPLDVFSGEWVKGYQNLPVCYTINNPKVTVKAKIDFRNYTGIITNVCVLAKQVGTEASLGNINPTNVTVTYQAAEHLFRVAGKTPGQVSLARSNEWEWVVTHVNEVELKKPFPFCTSGVHRVYTIFGEPKAPWNNTYGSPQNAWVTALDFAMLNNNCNGINSTHTALANITSYLHSGHGLTYDSAGGGGASYVDDSIGGRMYLTMYINKSNGNVVNCYDQAAAVCSCGTLLGINVKYGYMNPFGYLYKVNLIGVGDCNNPFYDCPQVCLKTTSRIPLLNPPSGLTDLIRPNRSKFGNHAFAILYGNVFDACSGPVLGKPKTQYVIDTVDVSTHNELYPPDWGGATRAGDSSNVKEYDATILILQ